MGDKLKEEIEGGKRDETMQKLFLILNERVSCT
jgi:hypothetical protein